MENNNKSIPSRLPLFEQYIQKDNENVELTEKKENPEKDQVDHDNNKPEDEV